MDHRDVTHPKPKQRTKPWKEKENAEVIRMFRRGVPVREIAEKLGRNYDGTRKHIEWLRKKGRLGVRQVHGKKKADK